ncbi:hypothetical protein [Acinetobacter seifertii]|uniref:hypothetical protein n=1 Tax=Acinetobacter seifertii TaxID=1530123 RepID=UPI001D17908E|nr:hypothetical protein [Acinetobacter seifertii]
MLILNRFKHGKINCTSAKQTNWALQNTDLLFRKNNKINIINGKIDLNDAMPAIIELLDKKTNKDNEVNFKQILNLLISQNIFLQEQLERAKEHEKNLNDELTYYRNVLNEKLSSIERTVLKADSISEQPIAGIPSHLESSQINEMALKSAEDRNESTLNIAKEIAKRFIINQTNE